MSAGETTPLGRVDLALGGATRLPTGDLRELPVMSGADTLQNTALGEGITPIAIARYGVSRDEDVELAVVGPSARVGYRREWLLRDGLKRYVWLLGPSFSIGKAIDRGPSAARGGVQLGVDLPFTYSADFGGVYEFWLGPRIGADFLSGRFQSVLDASQVRAFGLRAGGVLGFAAGFRRFHAIVELSAAYERWWMRSESRTRQRGGLVFIPAFALRMRL